ncbi:uncharacterized protein TRIADDRAFT_33519 [Trichoplax adhaerens]|uniref:Cilia- and flagella-associated protein 44 n=1 Tax=Trichoplax adhaerens TaxID=10228 RepID=B3SCU7_TRIAD|nr:hypothetical protein TRIADDRAFT_33519 [Trichoplax adhaerens]EDV19473.1 hypothetical protein TRIADDRAFT_33519 [Trichoplax adhaerens]|eukprot:XP_002118073.1 hypothetical protein TRIADDRAFT_33519 [Trichoplax adhaerens]
MQEEEEEEEILPDDFYYDNNELESKPISTSNYPSNFMDLFHSFGYECTKASNLFMMDTQHVLFSAGNFVQILNLTSGQQQHIRTTGGGGIGAIAVHPEREFFAVAERGIKPNINVYHYPSLRLHRILRCGTEHAYAHIDFSPSSGIHLASVGCSPDYTLTIWDWKKEKIVLRTKAFSQDVFNVTFSPENEGHLTTSGTGHIKFWTMAETFTGLKLKGYIGKFGRTQISDIISYVELPDGKVLSGTDWGNMLVWDNGLIKVQIGRKAKKSCHIGSIEGFFYDEGELITIGNDGYIRVWDFETVDSAEVGEEGQIFEMEPMYELKVGQDVKLKSMVKSVDTNLASIWYGQDASGGIWKLDLSFSHTTKPPEKLFSFHAGEITGMQTSPKHHMVATTAEDHTVKVYHYIKKQQLCSSKFNSSGTCLLWLPESVDPLGVSVLVGFDDGIVRALRIAKKLDEGAIQRRIRSPSDISSTQIALEQVMKPHNSSVTCMAIDNTGDILVTGGADSSIFFFAIRDTFQAIGFIKMPCPVVSIAWAPESHKKKVVLVCCQDGIALEVVAPKPNTYSTSKTYQLPEEAIKIRQFKFHTIKKKLRRLKKLKKKLDKKQKKKQELLEELMVKKAGKIEEEEDNEEKQEDTAAGEKGKEEEEVEEESDNGIRTIIRGFYADEIDHFWLSMGGYDAGYLYKCKMESYEEWQARIQQKEPDNQDTNEVDHFGEPVKAIPVTDSNDSPIRSLHLSRDGKLLILGFDNGIVRCQPQENAIKGNQLPSDIPELADYWSLSIHDGFYGRVTNICSSFDKKYILTTGSDGNFFVFAHNEMDTVDGGKIDSMSMSIMEGDNRMEDITDRSAYSLEDAKQKSEYDKRLKEAEEKKQNVRNEMANLRLRFKKILNRNNDLPTKLQLKRTVYK